MAEKKKSKPVRKTNPVRKPAVKRESIWNRGLRWATNAGNVFFKAMVLFFLYQICSYLYVIYAILAMGHAI